MARFVSKRTTQTILTLLALILLGTIAFLWAVKSYFSIDTNAIIRPEELGTWDEIRQGVASSADSWRAKYPWIASALSAKQATQTHTAVDPQKSGDFSDEIAKQAAEAAKAAGFSSDAAAFIPSGRDNSVHAWNATSDPPEKIPRIIHQTWKEKTLPSMWQAVRDECAKMHPDYEYRLWTDADSRQFLVENYPWFIPIFDAYPYSIQRADAIRYFILNHFGGIYMDLDVGCLRRLDPLLRFEIVLPKTIPVGVSNDVMAAAPRHPFMDHLIHNLVTFNHRYLTHYPTVMFSTGPMFLSASYGLYVDAHGPSVPSTPEQPSAGFRGIRVLPKPLYGKNARPSEAPDSFFRHFYGSSWHAGDADFLIYLRDHGKLYIVIGLIIVAYGASKTVSPRFLRLSSSRRGDGRRRRSSSRRGRWVSLPFIQDPRSGQYRSIPSDLFGGSNSTSSRGAAGRSLLDEGTQTQTPVTPSGAADALGRSQYAPHLSPSVRVAAPKPQRIPMFQLQEGDGAAGSDEEIDLGPGLNAERIAREKAAAEAAAANSENTGLGIGSGIVSWMQGAYDSAGPSSEAGGLLRAGSASKFKEKASSVLYLPAYLVGASSGSSADSSTTDSALASVRVGDDDESSLQSPSESPSSRTGTPAAPPWTLTRLHSRGGSTANGGFSNWAASFLGGGSNNANAASSSRGESSTLSKAWNNVSLAGRTPSPGLFLGNSFRSSRYSEDDLESCAGSERDKLRRPTTPPEPTHDDAYPLEVSSAVHQGLSPGREPASLIMPSMGRRRSSYNALTHADATSPTVDFTTEHAIPPRTSRSSPLAGGNAADTQPPPPYRAHDTSAAPGEAATDGARDYSDLDDATPTLTAKRIVGKRS